MKKKIIKEEDRQVAIDHLKGLKLGLDSKKRRRVHDYDCKPRNFKRSLKQNNLLWLWLGCIYDSTGNEPDYLYDHYIKRFAPRKEYINILGDTDYKIVTSSNMDESQMAKFLNRIDHDVSTEGINLLYPEDQHFEEFYDAYKNYVR